MRIAVVRKTKESKGRKIAFFGNCVEVVCVEDERCEGFGTTESVREVLEVIRSKGEIFDFRSIYSSRDTRDSVAREFQDGKRGDFDDCRRDGRQSTVGKVQSCEFSCL